MECQRQLTEFQENDEYLYSIGVRDLSRGDEPSACKSFDTLLERFPTSPLAEYAQQRLAECSRPTETKSMVSADKDGPLLVQRAWIEEDVTGIARVRMRLVNDSKQVVSAFKIQVRCYDEIGQPVKDAASSADSLVVGGTGKEIAPGGLLTAGPWSMTGFMGASRVETTVVSVEFTDGSKWVRQK